MIIKVNSDESEVVRGDTNQGDRFAWQEGYGTFSYSKSSLPDVICYIQDQEKHHRKRTFIDEYKAFLKAFEIEYEERFIFKEPS